MAAERKGPAKEFIKIIREVATPVLNAAGYERSKNEFQHDFHDGSIGVVGFYRDDFSDGSPGFAIQYGLVTQAMRELRESGRSYRRPAFLTTSQALIWASVAHPGYVARPDSRNFPHRWDAADSQTMSLVRQELLKTVLPRIEAWRDPRTLAKSLIDLKDGEFNGIGPLARAAALALADSPYQGELDQFLGQIPEDDDIRAWIESRRARRPASN